MSTDRRAEYARLLSHYMELNGGSLRAVAAEIGVSPETLRLNMAGKTVPNTRARVRVQDLVLKTDGALERALYDDSSVEPHESAELRAQVFELAARMDRTDAALAAVQAAIEQLGATAPAAPDVPPSHQATNQVATKRRSRPRP